MPRRLLRRTLRRLVSSVWAVLALTFTVVLWFARDLASDAAKQYVREREQYAIVIDWFVAHLSLLIPTIPLVVVAAVLIREWQTSPLRILFEDRPPYALRPMQPGLDAHRIIVVQNDSDSRTLQNVNVAMDIVEPRQAVSMSPIKDTSGGAGPYRLAPGDERAFPLVSYSSLYRHQDFRLNYADDKTWPWLGVRPYIVRVRVTADGVPPREEYFNLDCPDPNTGDLRFRRWGEPDTLPPDEGT
jgi:hypothetical protein